MRVPQNEYAEDNFLGLLMRGEISPTQAAEKGITEAHFIVRQGLFTAISEFIESGGELSGDFIMQLHAQGTLDQLGTAALINQIATHEGHFKSLESYVNHLRMDYGKRLVMQAGQSLVINPENPEAMAQVIMGKAEIELANNGSLACVIIERTFDTSNPPDDPPPMVKLGGHGIFSAGNISALIGDRKNGKSSAEGAVIAAIIAPPYSQGDFLGFTAENPKGKAVVHFDTEQSPADHHNLILRALHRAGLKEPPPWFSSYSLTGLSLADRTRFIDRVCDREAIKHGGLQMVLIDGIADLCTDPNDPHESFDLVEKWQNFSVNHHCVVLTVLHLNPGTIKSRGHLGSQLERKAETPLMIKKDAKGISTMYATHARKAHIPENEGFSFQWCDDAKMHVSVSQGDRNQARDEVKRNKAADEANKIMAGRDPMSYTELWQEIEIVSGVGSRTAKNRVRDWLNDGIITKSTGGEFSLK